MPINKFSQGKSKNFFKQFWTSLFNVDIPNSLMTIRWFPYGFDIRLIQNEIIFFAEKKNILQFFGKFVIISITPLILWKFWKLKKEKRDCFVLLIKDKEKIVEGFLRVLMLKFITYRPYQSAIKKQPELMNFNRKFGLRDALTLGVKFKKFTHPFFKT